MTGTNNIQHGQHQNRLTS